MSITLYFYKVESVDSKIPYSEPAERVDAGNMEKFLSYQDSGEQNIIAVEKQKENWNASQAIKDLFTLQTEDEVSIIRDTYFPAGTIIVDTIPLYEEGEDVGAVEEQTPISNADAFVLQKNTEGKYAIRIRISGTDMIFDVFLMTIAADKPRPSSVDEFKKWWEDGKA